jgi:branched-chain amino acid transport system ATP-binding protein
MPGTDSNDGELKLENINLAFGGVLAINDVSCEVRRGEIFSIIGPNGAGKTSLLNCISGFYRPQKGQIHYGGQRITALRPDRIARLGISRTFQNTQLYTGLSVIENLMAARHFFFKATWIEGILYYGRCLTEEARNRRAAEEIVEFLDLQAYRDVAVAVLPYGIRKRVDLGRSLAQQPGLLLLDEPMAGMNAQEKEDMCRFIRSVRRFRGTTMVLIEHDMGVVMGISDRIMALNFGKKIAEGTPSEIKGHPDVIEAYLGPELSPAG